MNTLKRLVGPRAATSGVIGTVPQKKRWHIRFVKFINPTATPITFSLGINGTGNSDLIIGPTIVPPNESYREVMDASLIGNLVDPATVNPETINLLVSASGGTIFINGIDQV